MVRQLTPLLTLLAVACGGSTTAIVDETRPDHFFDVPFPSDDLLRADGTVDLTGFPEADPETLLGPVVNNWTRRIQLTTQGFANNGAAYFRFEAPLEDVPASTTGDPEDAFLWVDLDTGELLPLDLRFVRNPQDDPFYAPNTLAMGPQIGHPPASGARIAAVVLRRAGVRPPAGYTLPDGVEEALERAGVRGRPAVATVFTVQDATGQLVQLFDAADAWFDAADRSGVTFKRAHQLDVAQGLTASGNEATVVTVTLEDNTTQVHYQSRITDDPVAAEHSHDLLNDWPLAVYVAELPVPNFSGLEGRPYMSPGVGHLQDTDVDMEQWRTCAADGSSRERARGCASR